MEQGKRLEECLCVRRSIRQFTDQPVERTIIQALLEMAILAPSASNRQPWRFIILDDPVLVQKIRAFSPGIGGNPPCLIVFCLESQRLPVMRNGAVRLLESAQKLIAFGMQWRISSDARLLKIAEQIENERGTALTDRERFYHSVEEISLLMVDII